MNILSRKIFATAALVCMLCLAGLVMTGEAQAQRFVDNGNGTVTDTVTGLMWTKDANPFGKLKWHDAMSRCSSFNISGIGGWRLPSRDELVAIYHAIQGGHPFTGVHPALYWSSSTEGLSTDCAWLVYMGRGVVTNNGKVLCNHVWPVRVGK